MKPITIYEAKDGSRHESKAACEKYERVCLQVDGIMSALKPRPNDVGCNFSNGHGFLQHSKSDFLTAQRALLKLARKSFKSNEFDNHFTYAETADKPVGLCFISRLISEGCPRPLDRAWNRLCCVDQQFREWGQPYYAINPDKGEQVSL